MLPLLSIQDLASLSCVCKVLRDLVKEEEQIWRSAAAAFLPLRLPALLRMPHEDIRAFLQRHAQARRNVVDSNAGSSVLLARKPRHQGYIYKVLFSPLGDFLAVVSGCKRAGQVSMYSVHSERCLWDIDLGDIDFPPESAQKLRHRPRNSCDWHFTDSLNVCIGAIPDDAPQHAIGVYVLTFDVQTGDTQVRAFPFRQPGWS